MRRHHILAELRTAGRSFIRQVLPRESHCVLRFNGVSTAHLTVADSHPAIPQLLNEGVRATVWMITVDGATLTRRRLLEGPIGDLTGDGPFGSVTFPVLDDFSWFSEVLGWQKPGSALNAQTDEYARYTGPSDTRALAAIRANATRLGLPWDVAESAGLGTEGTTEFRMHRLADRILPALNTDRLQLVIERDPLTDRWIVAVREGTVYSRPITPQSGVLADWKWKQQRRAKTRFVIGGAGQGVAREFASVIDADAEGTLQRILEGFDDSRMAEAGTNLVPYGQASLADAAPRSGVTARLRETSWFRFPTAYDIGTRVTIQAGAMTAEDIVTEIDISHTAREGFRVTPTLGFTAADPQTRLTDFVASLATSVRSFERN